MMMYIQNTYSDKYKKSLIGKIPSWAWMIIFGILSIGGNYFINQTTFNLLPFQNAITSGKAEMGNLIWMHFVTAPFTVLMFELVLFIYGQFVQMLARGAMPFPRKDFSGIFRAFYCGTFVLSGLLQIMCFYNSLTTVWFRIFGMAIPRLIMMFLFFLYLKKQYLDATNTHTMLKAVFIPYFIYEVLSLGVIII